LLNKKLERFIEMQKVIHLQAESMMELRQNINDFINVFEVEIKIMSIIFDPIMENYNAMIIYENK
jgi:hypothetical protein